MIRCGVARKRGLSSCIRVRLLRASDGHIEERPLLWRRMETSSSYKFNDLGLKRLITTCYKNQERDLFSQNNSERAIWLEYIGDKNGNRVPDPEEIGIRYFKGDGDFRSAECIELLKQADIVVTNPPFSLFREYVAQLVKYEKKFLIIGNQNAIKYKDIFPLFMTNKIWIGYGFKRNCAHFISKYEDNATDADHI